ncbi:serine hydrolase [Streptomyces sp. NPDC049906]|uniref:serine hydrolase n=1 Tax=Streptomyces sp. NPDC049906 TaxID=3155656 RepID=UPI00342650EA
MVLRPRAAARAAAPRIVLLVVVGSLLGGPSGCAPGGARPVAASPPASPAGPPRPVPSPTPTGPAGGAGAARAEGAGERLAEALEAVRTPGRARFSVAVVPVGSGEVTGYRSGSSYVTASIVKVDILVALLVTAQRAGRGLTAGERSSAAAMIRRSDNAAADALWARIGGAAGLDAANARLGMERTAAGGAARWGLTRTTAADQVELLRAVFGPQGSPALGPASRAYVQRLMGGVVAGQDWGVSAAGEGGPVLKNGWLPRSATGLWVVNSIGRVTAGGREYLVSVLSDGNASMAAGVALVERAAAEAVRAVADAEPDPAASAG